MTASEPSSPPASAAPRKRGLLHRLFLLLCFVTLALSIPPVFRAVIWGLLHEEAWRQGGEASVEAIQGSLWEPLKVTGLHVALPCADGGLLEFDAGQLALECAWGALIEHKGNRRFFDRCWLRGGRLHWRIGAGVAKASEGLAPAPPGAWGGQLPRGWSVRLPRAWGAPLPLPVPSWLDFEFKNASVVSAQFAVRTEDVGLTLSELASGECSAGKIEVQLKTWSKVFREVQGKTSLQGGKLQLGEMQFMEGLRIPSFSAALSQMAGGHMNFEWQAEAFGGELRGSAEINSDSVETPFEASGTFSNLGVAPLAAFLNVTEAAGGSLEAGKFSFRGNTSRPDRGTASLRLEAKNFQWESRQWDSLVLGATLLDRRIQVPELVLRQGHNKLVLNGDMQWPGGETAWWQSDFGVNVGVRVENLTELSALLLPEFTYAAGGLTVDGAIRRQAGVLGGALIVSGENLTWRSAPIEELHAAIKLQGEDIELLNFELTQGSDFLRGKGMLRVGEAWWYQGELHGKVRDLAKYASLLQPPLVSQPYAGGIDFDWSGKGAQSEREGKVRAQFRQLRPVKPQESWGLPMDGGISGSYDKNGVEVELASLGDEQIEVRTRASFGDLGVRLSNLTVMQGQATVLEGEALLPMEIWNAWPQIDWARVLKESGPVELRVASTGLNLAYLGRLPGMPRAIEGTLSGDWSMKGSLKNLEGQGALQLRQAAWLAGGGRVSGVGADLSWQEHSIQVRNLSWSSGVGLFEGKAALSWGEGAPPSVALEVACEKARWKAPLGLHFAVGAYHEGLAVPLSPVVVSGRAAWKVSGPVSEPLLSGEILVKDFDFAGVPDLRPLWREMDPKRVNLSGSESRFLKDCKLQLKITSGEGASVTGTTGAASVDLKVTGTAGAPEGLGEVRLALRGAAAGAVLELEPVVLKWVPGQMVPELEIRGHGTAPGGGVFQVNALGPLGHPVREYQAKGPLTPEVVRGVFEESKAW